MASFSTNVLDRWPAGTKLFVHPRLGDSFVPGSGTVKSVSVPQNGLVKVSVDAGPYWLSDGERAVAFTAKEPVEGKAESFVHRHGGLQSPAPGRSTEPNIITGARSTVDVKRRHQTVVLEDQKPTESEPQPHPKQSQAKGPQRSDTAFGEATPTDPNEIQPRLSQSDVGNVKQRSDTESGEATPVRVDEVQPAKSQEDVSGKQRSDTELGTAEPIPSGRKGEVKKRRDSSKAKARGETPAKPAEKTSRKP